MPGRVAPLRARAIALDRWLACGPFDRRLSFSGIRTPCSGEVVTRRRADPSKPSDVGSPMPGSVIALHVAEGAEVAEGDPVLTLEAMKMETIVRATCSGTVRELCTDVAASVQSDDLLVIIEPQS